jgi:hypothetical protein
MPKQVRHDGGVDQGNPLIRQIKVQTISALGIETDTRLWLMPCAVLVDSPGRFEGLSAGCGNAHPQAESFRHAMSRVTLR